MRSSESTETILVMLVIAIVIGLAGGYFLIKLDERNAAPLTAGASTVEGQSSTASPLDGLLKGAVTSDDFATTFVAKCSEEISERADMHKYFRDQASAKQYCGCIVPWLQEKILNSELTLVDFYNMSREQKFPNKQIERQFIKETEYCIRNSAA